MNTWKEKNGSTPLLPGRVWMIVVNRLVEWRAKRLEDPLDRLRYLRRSARTSARVTGWRPRKWHLAIAGVLLASLIISAYTISTTISTRGVENNSFGSNSKVTFPHFHRPYYYYYI